MRADYLSAYLSWFCVQSTSTSRRLASRRSASVSIALPYGLSVLVFTGDVIFYRCGDGRHRGARRRFPWVAFFGVLMLPLIWFVLIRFCDDWRRDARCLFHRIVFCGFPRLPLVWFCVLSRRRFSSVCYGFSVLMRSKYAASCVGIATIGLATFVVLLFLQNPILWRPEASLGLIWNSHSASWRWASRRKASDSQCLVLYFLYSHLRDKWNLVSAPRL
jgi:hypothetical protein